MGIDIAGIGALSELASDVVSRIWPDKSEQEKQQLAMALAIVQGQLAVNQVEAGHASLFVSGWRPFVGWCCGMACAWNWIGLSIANTVAAFLDLQVSLAPASLSEMFPVLVGMLGIGAYRTYEKIQGVASK